MELADYIRIIRKRWRMIAAAGLIGLIAASAFVLTATKQYKAGVQLFVSTQNTADASLTAAVQGSDFSEARVTSYAQIVSSPPVMQGVIKALGLTTTPQALATHISANAPLNTVLLNISVTDRSPTEAALLANTTATSFVQVITALEKPADGSPSTIRIAIIKQAFVPGAPTSPKKKLDLGIGLLLGLAVGVGGAVLRDTLDTSIKRPDDLAELTGQATLAVIAFDQEVASTPLIIDGSPHAPRAESLRQLRTNLQFVDVDNPPRSVLVTSAVPKEGKSSTIANLALTLARGGKKVILVEGDLRRPRLVRYLGLPADLPGITDVLVGKYTLDEALTPFRDENVVVLASGESPPNPSELLGSGSMRDLVTQLKERCDIVLIDAPPLLPVTDGAVLASICDGAIFVVRAGKTRREQVTRAIESLSSVDARLLGCVLNMASAKGPEAYAYGYGYGYAEESPRRGLRRRSTAKKAVVAAPLTVPQIIEPASPEPMPEPAPAVLMKAVAPKVAATKAKRVEVTPAKRTAVKSTATKPTSVATKQATLPPVRRESAPRGRTTAPAHTPARTPAQNHTRVSRQRTDKTPAQ